MACFFISYPYTKSTKVTYSIILPKNMIYNKHQVLGGFGGIKPKRVLNKILRTYWHRFSKNNLYFIGI